MHKTINKNGILEFVELEDTFYLMKAPSSSNMKRTKNKKIISVELSLSLNVRKLFKTTINENRHKEHNVQIEFLIQSFDSRRQIDSNKSQTISLNLNLNKKTPKINLILSPNIDWLNNRRRIKMKMTISSFKSSSQRPQIQINPKIGTRISSILNKKPIILAYMKSDEKKQKLSRSKNSNVCERKRLIVNFKSIGLDHIIVEPKTVKVDYCDGTCSEDDDSMGNHAIVRRLATNRQGQRIKGTCCAPKRTRAMWFLIREREGDYSSLVLRKVDDLIVKSCGCQ